jgi:serine/threonine protein kinase
MPRCPNPRCQTDYPPGTVQCTKPFCQCLLPEAVIAGRYRIETLIGMGGMGAVYRASDTFEVEQIALKVLSFANSAGNINTAVERFRREARYAHQLKHKNIVPVLNFGQDGKFLYLVMPLVTGGTLKALLKTEHPLPTPQAQRYLNDLAEAIDAIHHHPQQIVHRDIKPSNLLIHQDDDRLVVTDFGIARAMQQEKALTQRGWTLGTEHYIAPEQEHGKAEPASDIYAMGVIAYQMFTGLLPFQAVVRNRAADLPAPSTLNNTLPTAIDPVILRAIDIDPSKRFRTAHEFADALNAVLTPENNIDQEHDTDNAIWTAPTLSVGVGIGQSTPPTPSTQASLVTTNVIVRAIIPENPCGRCGRENRKTSHFCRYCGHTLDETSPLVTDVCQVGYLSDIGRGEGSVGAGREQNTALPLRGNKDMLLIVQGLCNTLQPPPRPFSLFAIADGREPVGVTTPSPQDPQGKTTGDHEVGTRWKHTPTLQAPALAIETITDVLLPLLSTSGSAHSFIGTPAGAGSAQRTGSGPHIGSTSSTGSALGTIPTGHIRLQPTKQTDEERIEQWMRNAVRQANRVIYHCSADYDITMASTLATILLYKRHLYLANVGDNRAYYYNEKTGLQQINTGSKNTRISRTPAGAQDQPPQPPVQDQATINHYLGEQYQVAIELFKHDVEVDDLILLCTSGIWRILNNEQIQNILALGGDTQRLAYTLVEAANTAGGIGNISAIVVRVQ